jgi:hypothetical protein
MMTLRPDLGPAKKKNHLGVFRPARLKCKWVKFKEKLTLKIYIYYDSI